MSSNSFYKHVLTTTQYILSNTFCSNKKYCNNIQWITGALSVFWTCASKLSLQRNLEPQTTHSQGQSGLNSEMALILKQYNTGKKVLVFEQVILIPASMGWSYV